MGAYIDLGIMLFADWTTPTLGYKKSLMRMCRASWTA
jgi:hypothetical protein